MKSPKLHIMRLSQYRNAVGRLKSMGFVRIFSENLADAIGVNASQVRKDFSIFEISGTKKSGYRIDDLLSRLDEILGKDKIHEVVLAGAGHIGSALMTYKGFEKEGIRIVAVFDNDTAKQDREAVIPVLDLKELPGFVKKKNIKIGIIAVPDDAAQKVCDLMTSSGIKGVLNFAPICVNVPDNCLINNINLAVELETLICLVNVSGKGRGTSR